MKLNKFLLVSMLLLAIISIGAVSAADMAANDTAVTNNEDSAIGSSQEEITANSEDVAIGSEINEEENSKLCATDDNEILSEKVNPTYTWDIDLPETSSGVGVVQWGQPIPVSADFGDATGTVLITFNNVDYDTVPLVDGKFSFDFTKYPATGNNRVFKVTYSGDDDYNSVSFEKKINVQFNEISATTAYYGLHPYVEVNLYEATGNVTFTLNGKTFTKTLENGTAIQEFTNYKLGSNSVSFSYLGDNYAPISKSLSFSVAANIDAPTIYYGQPAIIKAYLGEATGNVTFTFNGNSKTVGIENGVATYEAEGYTLGENNQVTVAYSGDENFNSFSTNKKFTVLNKENATILSSVYKIDGKDTVIINIPFGTGNITAIINGKEEELELVNGTVYYDIDEGVEITEINVTYGGNSRLNPASSSVFKYLNNVVTGDNYMYYFNQQDGGKVFDFIKDGTTLDFQGSIINPDEKLNVYFDVNKPLNIVSTTGDAYIDLNTTAGSLLGENPGNRFTISYGGSWSNVTGINFHNTQLWLFNTHHVVLDRVSNVIEDKRVGSGVGATSIRANSTWVTVKNSYFYTRNNGGSSSLVIAWADYCTFDNNTIVVEGEVGNMIYLTTYNVEIPSGVLPNVYNNITNNKILAPNKNPAAICWGLVISGANNYVADNYINYGGVGINQQWGQGDFINNTYTGNVLVGGASANFLPTSIVYNNTIEGTASTGASTVFFNNTVGKALTVGADAEAYDNVAGGLTLSGANSIVHDNVIDGATTISKNNIQIYDNTFLGDNAIKFNSGAKENNFVNNNVVGYIEFGNKNAANNNITDNTIITSKNYAVDLKTYVGTGNNISDNVLVSAMGTGNDAVNHREDDTLIVDNYQNESAEIYVTVEPIKVGQDAVFNIETNVTTIAQARIVVAGKEYTVNLTEGKGSISVPGILSGSHNVIVTSLDKKYSAQNSTTLIVTKNDCPEIVVDAPDKTQWIDSNITVTINDATGKVTLSINGTVVSGNLVEGVAVLSVPDLAPGEYDFTVSYEGDYQYSDNSTTGTLKVNRNKQTTLIVDDLSADELASEFNATLVDYVGNGIAGVELTMTVNSQTIYAVTNENGTATFDISLTTGIYPVNVTFSETEEYYAANATATITVIGSAEIIIECEPIKVGQDAVFNIETTVTAIAQVRVDVDGKSYVVNLTDGKGSIAVPGLLSGDYDVIVTSLDQVFVGENSTTLSVTKNDCPEIVVDAPDKDQGVSSNITVTIGDATGKVTLSINGVDVSIGLSDGIAVFSAPDLAPGEYDFTVSYEGDYKYLNNSATGTLKVNKNKQTTLIVTDLVVNRLAYGFKATLVDYMGKGIADAELTINVNNQDITAFTDANGIATFDISLTMGIYPVTVTFSGIPDEYDAANADATITVIDRTSIAVVAVNGDDFAITAVLKDVNGNPIANAAVSYTINDGEKVNTTTNDKGEFVAYVQDNSLITFIFDGNDYAVASSASITLKNIRPVQKATKIVVPTTMTKTAVDYNAGERGTMFYFNLQDADGKPLANKAMKVGIFDKIYTVKTDSNGRAGLQINIANANYYTYAITFLGDDDYKASFAVCSLQIVKKSVTITPAKTSYSFKANAKTKTVTATLKSSNSYIPKGKQVTLTIAGKTFKAKIGDKGQINFNIGSITKKGTYKVAIKYAGSNTYSAATSKTITVKIA